MTLNIAIDVDGVLAEQVPAVLEPIRDELGVEMEKEEVRSWDEAIPDTDTNIKILIENHLEDPEFVRRMSAVDGAVEGVRTLERKGHRLIIATARGDHIKESTENWLQRHGFEYDEVRSVENRSKSTLHADLLVDDYPKNVVEFSGSTGTAILFLQPWNEDFAEQRGTDDSIYVANGWDEVLRIVDRLESADSDPSKSRRRR